MSDMLDTQETPDTQSAPDTQDTAAPSDTPDTRDAPEPHHSLPAASSIDPRHPLDHAITAIRAGIALDASAAARAVGATACRSILTALEATAGQPLATPPRSATSSSPPPPPLPPIAGLLAQLRSMPRDRALAILKRLAISPNSPISGVLTQLAEMPREQLLDVLNQQLRALAPAGIPIQPPAGPRFHLIEIPQTPRRPGGSK